MKITRYIFLMAAIAIVTTNVNAQDSLFLNKGFAVTVSDINGNVLSVEELLVLAIKNDFAAASKQFNRASNYDIVSYSASLIGGSAAGYATYGLITGSDVTTNLTLLGSGVALFFADIIFVRKKYNTAIEKGVLAYNEALYQKRQRMKSDAD